MTLSCVAPGCAIPRRHVPGCTEDGCRGCLPGLAASGRNLCEHCTRRIAENARTAATLYAELEAVLIATGRAGAPISGSHEYGTELNPRAVECRTLIRHTLASWCRLVCEERGHALPEDTVESMAHYVARNAVWLSAHPAAGECADELRELARGLPWRTAYPTGVRRYPVGPCPLRCGGTIHAVVRDTDHLLPSVLTCDTDEGHTWGAESWRALGRALHPDGAAGKYVTARETATTWRLALATVHWYAHRYEWRRSEDGRRPVLYLAADVDATMRTRATKRTYDSSVSA